MAITPATAAEPLLSARLAAVVRAAHEAYFPAGGMRDPVPHVEHVFSDAKHSMRRLIRICLWGLELSTVMYTWSRFSRLTVAARTAWLQRLGRSKVGLAKAIYAIVKVLLQSVAYDDPAVAARLSTPREGA